jgi:hypothetical protein
MTLTPLSRRRSQAGGDGISLPEKNFGLPSFAYSVPERPVNPCMTPQVSKVSGLASLLRGRGAKSPDSIILIRPLLLRPLKGIQYPRSNFPMDHLTSPSGTL